VIAVAGWVCLGGAAGLWFALRACDEWAPATVAAFGSLRPLALLPAVLLGAAVFVNRRALWSLVPALLLTLGPVTGFCVPWGRSDTDPGFGPRVRVMTCNMHFGPGFKAPLDRLIGDARPDVVVIQEWRDRFGSATLTADDWHIHRERGQFLASRYPIRRADRLGDRSTKDSGSVARYELDTPAGVVTVFSVHLASPRAGLEGAAGGAGLNRIAVNSALRWTQSRHLAAAADQVVGPVVLAGDFNTPPHSAIFRNVWGGYEDAFSNAGLGWGYTFRARATAVRIDHILVGGGGRVTRCWVGPNVGSPHRPVLADLEWPSGAP
jgi:endonuclease/exonuclease/phosphatase (EEP) superfamily protein YafD